MHTIIVVPPDARGTEDHSRLASGEKLAFGRSAAGGGLTIAHEGVSRAAGVITAHGAFWTLSNLSAHQTYVVENPEGAGEHIKVVPGRVDAPVPFEFSRVVLPAAGDLLAFDVWAPHQEILDTSGWSGGGALTGTTTAPAFSLDHTKRYFAVLVALCEPRLRGVPHAPPPTAEALVERLRATWPTVTRATVQWNINYLAVKLRLKPDPDTTAVPAARLNGKKELLVSLALRFDLVREDDLVVLAAAPSRVTS
ncbi:FHA domain-containing protein [Streptomyces ferrugineus]|uniref:FHA domain-containing protein n=1 Tax=Streptomyces ferrugineus TaxID=1413221 RepID=A0A7M2SIH1_9ACTN|nr:FHA domain-containing protein [Streptomyces ferrugineus]QOV36136.1 FHA domain-containing protein [Streptomyces ferrugineus]